MASSTPVPASRLQEVIEIGHRYRQAQADPVHSGPSENERMLRVAQENTPTPAPTGTSAAKKPKQSDYGSDWDVLWCGPCMRLPEFCCFCCEC